MSEKVKSGKEMLDDFFSNIKNIEGVDESIAIMIQELYQQGKLTTDTHIKQALQKLKDNAEESKN